MGPILHVEDFVTDEAVTAIEKDSSLGVETVDLTNASPESEVVSLVEMDIESRIDAFVESCEKGDTNLIMMNRENIFETGFEEILALKDKFTTLEVQFYSEVSLFY